jgi:peroxiredoxin
MKISPRQLIPLVAVIAIAAGGYVAFSGQDYAPEVRFMTLKGESLKTSDLRGKVVLVNFWATDCVICVHEMPRLVETYNKFQNQGFETVAVAMSYDPPNYVARYSEKNRLPFKVALDVQGDIARGFGEVRLTPTTFILDRRGQIIKRYVGEPDFAQLHRVLEEALKRPV